MCEKTNRGYKTMSKKNEKEIWKPVVGFEEKYEISNLGNLMSNNWNRTGQRRMVKTYLNKKTGYIYVVL